MKLYPEYTEKTFDNLVTSDEILINYFEPYCKSSNRIWASKNAKRSIKECFCGIAKRLQNVKKVFMGVFFVENKGSVMLIPVPKYKTVAANFKNVLRILDTP